MKTLKRFIRRLWRVLTPHQHSIYIHCFECHAWGVNMPDDGKCSNCGSLHTSEYYPTGFPK